MSALKRIKVWDLQQGMIIVRCDRAGVPFNEYGIPLTNIAQAQKLAAYGVENVYIWLGDSKDGVKKTEAAKTGSDFAYSVPKEDDIPSIAIAAAGELAERSLKTVEKAINDMKKGNLMDVDALNIMISDIVHTSVDTPGIFTGMTPVHPNKNADDCAHGLNVCLLAISIGQVMGVKGKEIIDLGLAAILHDVGKARVPEKILNKKSTLTETEFSVLKKHPAWGAEMLSKNSRINNEVLLAVSQHHESCDGSGYPSALAERYLTRNSKILAIAETYETMLSGSVEFYQVSHNTEAVKRIYAGIGRQYCEDAVKAFITVVGIYPVGTVVKLNDGNLALVCEVNKKDQSRPKVILLGKDGKGDRFFINLAKKQDTKVTAPVNHEEYGIDPDSIFNEFLADRIKAQING